jgi:hypothetical protein
LASKQRVFGVLAGLALSACATSPLDGGTISSNRASFGGFAIDPSAPVRVQVLATSGYPDPEYPSATWETLTPSSLKASSAQTSLSTTRPLYSWNASVTVPEQYYHDGSVFLRAQQLWAGSWMPMYMYDSLGLSCLVERYLDAYDAGVPLNVDTAGIECSRDPDGEDLHYVELAKPGLKADLIPYRFSIPDNIWLWLVPDVHVPDNAALFPVPFGPPAELLCDASSMNVAFGYKNQGGAVATRRRDRVSIPELGLEDIDEQPRLRAGRWDVAITGDILFPPEPGRYATFDLSSTEPNQVYTLAFDINYDNAMTESDYTNNRLEVEFMRKCP